MPEIRLRPLLAAALAALAACPLAAAHGDGGARGFRSKPTGLRPQLEGVTVRVLDGDDQLQLSNRSGKTVFVLGYSGEPYLVFARNGVFRNVLSPATYMNRDRYARAEVPTEANPKARPRWQRLADGNVWSWHDHRIHWMSRIPPPQVRARPEQRHRIFDWRVPLRVDGRRLAIRGQLNYVPPSGPKSGEQGTQAGAVVLTVVLVTAGGGLVLLLFVLARRKPGERPAG